MEHIATIERLVRRVRWRVKVQRALNMLAKTAYVSVCAAAVTVLLYKTLVIGPTTLWWSIGICVAVSVAAGLLGILGRVSTIDAATMLDAQGGTHSRLGTALAFAQRRERTPLMQLAIEDATKAVTMVRPKSAAPLALPAALMIAAAASFFVTGGAVYYHYEAEAVALSGLRSGPAGGGLEVPKELPSFNQASIDARMKERLAEEQKELEARMKATADPRVKKILAMLNRLIRDLQSGKLTLKEAFKRMAELDRAKAQWRKEHGEGLKEVGRKVKKAAESVRRPNKDVEPLLKALRQEDMKRAARELEKLAKKMEDGTLDKRRQRAIRKDMQKLAEALKTERQKRAAKARKERDRLKKKRDRLARKSKKDRLNKRDRNRLERQQRQLEKLRREREQMSEARRQLERLQRQMDRNSAAQNQRRQSGSQQQKMTAQQMRRAAEMMRRMSQQARSGKTMRVAEGKIVDLKEVMRRAGKQGSGGKRGDSKMDRFIRLAKGQGKDGQGKDGQGKDGQGKSGQGKSGQGKSGQGKGGQGKGGQIFKIGKNGEMVMLGQGSGGKRPSNQRGMGQGQQDGDGIGDGHDGQVLGRATNLDARHQESKIRGREAEGESRSRVVMTAARKGFATRQYRRVHQDYSRVVEETLDRQEVPAGQRRYVRRYFDLIRPR